MLLVYPHSTPGYTMSQGSLRCPAQASDIRRAGQPHLWLSTSRRQALSSCPAGIAAPGNANSTSTAVPIYLLAKVKPSCLLPAVRRGMQSRQTPHPSQVPTLAVTVLLGRSSRSDWSEKTGVLTYFLFCYLLRLAQK